MRSLALAALLLFVPAIAHADADASADADANANADAEGIQPTTTSDNLGCATSPSRASTSAWPWLALAILTLRKRRVLAALLASAPALAHAQDTAPQDPEPPMRRFAIYVNPLSLIVDRYGASIEVLLASHHAVEAGAYYVYSATSADANVTNTFEGVGGELGYRFYLGQNGFRGFYVGPSFLLASLTAKPAAGASTSYLSLGGALDVGFQALVADRVLVGIGGGAQYTAETVTLPAQALPASVYANAGLRPRASISIGVAF